MAQAWQQSTHKGLDESLPGRGVALVVEPEPTRRAEAAVTLRSMGFKTHETGCGAVGQFIATQITLHVVVVDVVLPDINGLQLIKRVRGLSPDAVIVATAPPGGAWEATAGLAHHAGADIALSSLSGEALGAVLAARHPPRDEYEVRAD
ncbi:MAG TPA: response regulator [Vitreimonas sp.]|nr:response regulator [Vitreimonas sp.]